MSGDRFIAGRLAGVQAEPGTVLGPKDITREWMVVVASDEDGSDLGYAQTSDLDAAAVAAMVERGPRSVAEARMVQGWQAEERARLRALFGGAS